MGKTFIDEHGYRRFINSGKLVHRWLVERELGRKLFSWEVVHHINRNKLDNRLENLQVIHRFFHTVLHAFKKLITGRR